MATLLIQDTSVLINLLATGRFSEIASTSERQFAICMAVQNETKTLWNPETNRRETISLTPLFNLGLLQMLDLDTQEERDFHVELCSLPGLGAGEAMCISLAISRQLEFATDDQKASRIYSERSPALKTISTPDILFNWQERDSLSEAEMGQIITRIEGHSKFKLAGSHPHFSWWQRQKLAAST